MESIVLKAARVTLLMRRRFTAGEMLNAAPHETILIQCSCGSTPIRTRNDSTAGWEADKRFTNGRE
eukprot:3856847-Amphidinium_carterae.1